MNYGWKRRKDKKVLGFKINPVTGHWVGGENETGEENGDEAPPDKTPPQRIVPFVEDRRNIPGGHATPSTGCAVRGDHDDAAIRLKRGIESVYQLEESELIAEPLPGRDSRQSILFFEAAEGGAGVLTRIATEPQALRRGSRRWRSCIPASRARPRLAQDRTESGARRDRSAPVRSQPNTSVCCPTTTSLTIS